MLDLLNNDELMNEYVLSKIIRYNHRRRLQSESVAEHTCFVSLFCLKIMAQLNLTNEQQRRVLILAALHDTCESKTSDIPHDVKVNYPEMQDILDKVELDYFKESWNEYCDVILNPGVLEHSILKLADVYSVKQWCLNEKSLGNNCDYVYDIYIDAMNRIELYTKQINHIIRQQEKENEDE